MSETEDKKSESKNSNLINERPKRERKPVKKYLRNIFKLLRNIEKFNYFILFFRLL